MRIALSSWKFLCQLSTIFIQRKQRKSTFTALRPATETRISRRSPTIKFQYIWRPKLTREYVKYLIYVHILCIRTIIAKWNGFSSGAEMKICFTFPQVFSSVYVAKLLRENIFEQMDFRWTVKIFEQPRKRNHTNSIRFYIFKLN